MSCIASHLETPAYEKANAHKIPEASLVSSNFQTVSGCHKSHLAVNGKRYSTGADHSSLLSPPLISSWASSNSITMNNAFAVHPIHTPGTSLPTLKVFLPGGMHTCISIKSNQRLCDALERKITQRDWRVSICY